MNNSKVAQSRAYGHTFHCLKMHVQKQLIGKNFQSSAFLFVVQCMYLEIISVLLLQNVSFLVNSMIIEIGMHTYLHTVLKLLVMHIIIVSFSCYLIFMKKLRRGKQFWILEMSRQPGFEQLKLECKGYFKSSHRFSFSFQSTGEHRCHHISILIQHI